jgi:DNA-binding transcriptional ArsR family regulator
MSPERGHDTEHEHEHEHEHGHGHGHEHGYDTRVALLRALLEKVHDDPYPSATMLDMIESLLRPREVPVYVEELLDRVREDRFPSIDMLQRIERLV